jgi:hypothetical protein
VGIRVGVHTRRDRSLTIGDPPKDTVMALTFNVLVPEYL